MDVPAPLDTDVAIETPEHIVFRHRIAGPARRIVAFFLDLLILYVAVAIVSVVIVLAIAGAASITGGMTALGTGAGMFLILLFAAQWIYFFVLEGWRGTTPGKAIFGMRVVTTAGRPIGYKAAALRNVLRPADALPISAVQGILAPAALTAMVLSSRFQRLGDLVAGTMVIIPERTRSAESLVLWPPAQPHELAALPLDVQLNADERNAIELFLRRRNRLGRARELELANMLAPALTRRFGFRADDPSRTLALLYDRAANGGRAEAPVSSRGVRR